jgi:O-succinylbenzoic acid--CoA ligase
LNRLIALDMPANEAFVESVFATWESGDAVFPVDQRLPSNARKSIVAAMGAARVIDSTGDVVNLSEGLPVELGDALVIATSGSTGEPKGVVHSHVSIAASAQASNKRLGTTTRDHWLACLPVSHIGGFSVITRARAAGCQLSIHDSFDSDAVEHAARSGATMTSLVSTALTRVDASLFRKILLGAGPAPQNLPVNIVKTYGMTETGSGVAYDGVALDGVEIRVDESGEIFVRGAMLLRCYRDGTDPKSAGGWLATNDIGSYVSGVLRVDGRRGDLIITGGENVWPVQVEASIATHPSVSEVCVRGVADETWGNRVVAWIVTKQDTAITLAETREWVKQTLPAFCAPQEIRRLEKLPRTSIGKIDTGKLR